nr:AAA family ATPase [Actinomycetota bacterium]
MPATATLTLLVIERDSEQVVEVFASVRAAVAAGVDALRAGTASDRAAISVGEVQPDDLAGSTAMADAMTLFAAAQPGDLLLSPTARALLGDHRFDLEGRADGVAAVDWSERTVAAPLPAFLSWTPRLVGRQHELTRAAEAVAAARVGRPQVLLLRGEAGIGKTALAGAIARAARDDGVNMLAGRASEEGTLPYQPLAEALRPVIEAGTIEHLTEAIGPSAQYLAAMFPRLGAIPATSGSEEARSLLRRAFSELLADVARRGPTALILDDVQWMPRPAMELVDALRTELDAPLLIMATLRQGEVSDEKIDTWLTAWSDDPSTTVIEVGPLGLADTAALIELHGHQLVARPDAVSQIHWRSAGNPFFVEELALHLGSDPSGGETPE